jgi:lipoprotein-anchoring transpeptidase ErfK/SrfK
MSTTSLQNKTVRPGSLLGYSYYYSKQTKQRSGGAKQKPTPRLFKHTPGQLVLRWSLVVVIALALIIGGPLLLGSSKPVSKTATLAKTTTAKPPVTNTPKATPAAAPTQPVAVNDCAVNQTADRLVLVSISQRHLWACQGSQAAYDSPVVTGIAYLAADLTPTGTYHIYGKETNITLKGSDTTGSWSDPVSYWMPFLHNQYGSYGFHDATWRPDNAFGNIDPNSADASHGCVELPLATAAWLYNWAGVGTTVTIEN